MWRNLRVRLVRNASGDPSVLSSEHVIVVTRFRWTDQEEFEVVEATGKLSDLLPIYRRWQDLLRYEDVAHHVFREWPGYTPEYNILASLVANRMHWIMFQHNDCLLKNRSLCGVRFSVEGSVCHLGSIGLWDELQGQNLGSHLYGRVVEFARRIDCSIVVQTPSGSTIHGEPRENYLARRGWTFRNGQSYIELQPGAARKYFGDHL